MVKLGMDNEPLESRLDRTAFSVVSLEASSDELWYWLTQTPLERLRHLERLRRINYGHRATERLQRVFEVVERAPS
ncbi:MAG: hypothetical protein NT142_13020 [Planctomycetota bacterium]|nr:hypothetical protein [Planctomycetota bacterium]